GTPTKGNPYRNRADSPVKNNFCPSIVAIRTGQIAHAVGYRTVVIIERNIEPGISRFSHGEERYLTFWCQTQKSPRGIVEPNQNIVRVLEPRDKRKMADNIVSLPLDDGSADDFNLNTLRLLETAVRP